jgi:hypothetical protein
MTNTFIVPTSYMGNEKDTIPLINNIRNMPENIKMNIYMFSRPRTTNMANNQIKNNALAYRSITCLKYIEIMWLDELENHLYTDIQAPSWCEYLNSSIPLQIMSEIQNDLSKCQCCKRHYGEHSHENTALFGTPINTGVLNTPCYNVNVNYINLKPQPTCSCPCRHYGRWMKKIINDA